ncbi:hypothetical protein FACS189490_05620 [Clostridia bacterium]|nr:hypothetical protein FACS189490_05620 [Clostridia bacterium]
MENEQKNGNSGFIITAVLGVLAVGILIFAGFMLLPFFGGGEEAETAETPPEAKLVLYEGPKTYETSQTAKIFANGNELFVYDSAVNPARTNKGNYDVSSLDTTPMTYFDFDGEALIEISLSDGSNIAEIMSASVSPLASGIKPEIKGNSVSFKITEPGQYTVQFNNSPYRAAHIFANSLETTIPDKNDPNVLWVEPGEWTVEEGIQLLTGQTLYLSGGAVLHATVSAQFAENVKILGRGMIDGGIWDTWRGSNAKVPVDFRYCKNVEVEGIIINNSNAWCFNAFETEHAVVDNVKIISARPNGDGFTLQSCRDFVVKNGFSRTWDDSLVVKNYEGNTDGITFSNMLVWTDLAQSCEIGYETNKGKLPDSKLSNIVFENITVINAFHKPVLSIHNSDDALVENVTYRNIVVENAAMGGGDAGENRQLIDIYISGSGWTSTKERGRVRNVSFENISVIAGTQTPTIRITGFDEKHNIDGVSIKGLTVFGKPVTDFGEVKLASRYAENVTIE